MQRVRVPLGAVSEVALREKVVGRGATLPCCSFPCLIDSPARLLGISKTLAINSGPPTYSDTPRLQQTSLSAPKGHDACLQRRQKRIFHGIAPPLPDKSGFQLFIGTKRATLSLCLALTMGFVAEHHKNQSTQSAAQHPLCPSSSSSTIRFDLHIPRPLRLSLSLVQFLIQVAASTSTPTTPSSSETPSLSVLLRNP